jgi:hypothetical protein
MSLTLLPLLLGGAAHAVEFDYSGYLQTDIRYRPQTISVGSWHTPLSVQAGFNRNQNLLKNRLQARGDGARLVMDADFVMMGFSDELNSTRDMSRRELIDPFRFEVHDLYMELWDFIVPGMDLRVGQQKIQWGVGDQFNPTNNLNADDLEDPLLFGDQLGNVMARLDYSPIPAISLSAVAVPVFKPALLPDTGHIALGMIDRVPVVEDELRRKLAAEALMVEDSEFTLTPTVVNSVTTQLPENTLDNMQWQVRAAFMLGMHDVALSWYDGRFDFPLAVNNHTVLQQQEQCNPNDPDDCINGKLLTDATVAFPKMKVAGLNASGEINPLGWMGDAFKPFGYRLEFAAIFPEATSISLTNDQLDILPGLYTQDAGEYDYELGGRRPLSAPGDTFFKWVLGLDYTFGRHVYVNAQWVHGMPDEWGAGDWLTGPGYVSRGAQMTYDADGNANCSLLEREGETCINETMRPRIGDYAVVGMDITFRANLLRLFGIVDFTPIVKTSWNEQQGRRTSTTYAWHTDQVRSFVFYPEFSHNFGNGFESSIGAVALFGSRASKFGDPAGGGTQYFAKARYSF